MNIVAKNIKILRKSANLSQQELAERIIVTRQTISNWERGVSMPDVEILVRVAVALEVKPADLIYGQQPATTFMKTRPARIRRAAVLGMLWLMALGLMVFLLPELYRNKLDMNLYPYWIGYCTIWPAVYGLGVALYFYILAVWNDFRIKSRCLHISLLTVGFSMILLYPILLLCTSWTAFHVWIWENPFIFVIPGVLLFCGFNRKSSEDEPQHSLTEDGQTGVLQTL